MKKPLTPDISRMPKVRTVPLNYKVKSLGQENIDRIIRYYKQGTPLHQIVRILNGRNFTDQIHISLIDCYSVLYQAKKEGLVTQRTRHQEIELNIDHFRVVYECWCKKVRIKDVVILLPGMDVAIQRAYKSLGHRLREQNKKHDNLMEISAAGVLSLGTQTVIDGRPALVVYLDNLPQHLKTKELHTEITSDMIDIVKQLEQEGPVNKNKNKSEHEEVKVDRESAEREMLEMQGGWRTSARHTGKPKTKKELKEIQKAAKELQETEDDVNRRLEKLELEKLRNTPIPEGVLEINSEADLENLAEAFKTFNTEEKEQALDELLS